MADTKKLKKTVGKSAVRNTIQISAGDRIYYAIVNVLLGIFTIIVLMPLLNVLASSFSSPEAVNYGWVLFWPVDFSLEGYEAVFEYKGLWQAYGNTFFYAIVGTALNITMTMVCAYPMARKNLPGRKWITWLFMFTMYFGGGTIPNYVLVRKLGMMDTRAAMIIPGAMSVYNMIIARSFFESGIPESIYESATIDGAGWLRCYTRFAIPLSKPMIAVLTLFFALGHWNSYFNAMIYISNEKIQVLQVIIKQITANISSALAESMTDAEMIKQVQEKQLLKYAVVVVSVVPMVLLYPFVQRYLIQGIMIGAVKG